MECKLLSHPDKLLKDHLTGVLKVGLNVFHRNKIFTEYEDFISAILLFHDFGKASSYFQNYLKKTKSVHEKLKRHAEISALWFYFYSKKILALNEKEAILGYIIIKHHHANLNNFKRMCTYSLSSDDLLEINDQIHYSELQYIYHDLLETQFLTSETFKKSLNELTRNGNIKFLHKTIRELAICDYLFLNYFFSILLTADKCDAIVNQDLNPIKKLWQKSFVDQYKNNFSKNDDILNKIRNDSYDEVVSNIKCGTRFFSINLPTGAGKTLTVLNAALKLKDINKTQRIIYCLPFTSVIDQNAKVFEDILEYNHVQISSDVILKQHHLTDFKYILNWNDEDRIYSAQHSEFFIEGWESEMIVTTFFQFLHTLLSCKNKSIRKFHNFSNSIVILDEVQAIPNKYWALVRTMLQQSADLLNIHFILVTATMPLIFSEKKNEIMELAVSKQNYFNALNRIKLCTKYLKESMHINDFKKIILQDIKKHPEKSRLIILNTIKSSLELYLFLKSTIYSENLIYLSSNIIPEERLNRIINIKKKPQGKIIVSTQIVEAGVDIDIDIVYRDIAPLDSIFQACGRCNRNNSKSISRVLLFQLTNNKKPFHSYIYDSVLIDTTKIILSQKNLFEEKEFLSLAQQYFEKVYNYHVDESESENILANISKLRLNYAFVENSDNNEPIFKLIDSFSVIVAFIEINTTAQKIYNNYKKIIKTEYTDPFQKRIELKSIYRKMAPYLINIPENSAKNSGYDESFGKIWFITNTMIECYYDKETGFKRDQEIVDYIF